ncbi:NUDIX hydrolase [Actinobacteria bacterium OK074]|nr:NUDIX hydrolase [Actinobacteria bacterium OK074]
MIASARARRAYDALRTARPEWFRNEPDGSGGIEIVTDPGRATAARRRAHRLVATHLARGRWWKYWGARLFLAVRPVPVGVVSADPFLCHLREPVRFPDGTLGLYNRIVPPPQAGPGVVVLPLVGPDNEVLLIEHYRHATREWHWEVVRGFGEPGASGAESVVRELAEELSAHPEETIPLGELHPDTGLLAHRVLLFAARIDAVGELEKREGIRQSRTVSGAEAERMVHEGGITDGFTVAALYRARLAGLFG